MIVQLYIGCELNPLDISNCATVRDIKIQISKTVRGARLLLIH